jgi:regulator of sigma E protease
MGFDLSMKLQPTVGVIAQDSEASKSELMVNDRILAVNSQSIKSFEDLRIFLENYQGSDLDLKILRDEQTLYLNVPLSIRQNAKGEEEKYIGIITRDLGTQNLSGPIGIVQMAGDTAKAGFMPFLYLMALLSISLGVLNLLPIPVLDGGQLVMLGIEAVRGSPMPEKMENLFYMSGWVAVGFLMIFAVFNDISKFL